MLAITLFRITKKRYICIFESTQLFFKITHLHLPGQVILHIKICYFDTNPGLGGQTKRQQH